MLKFLSSSARSIYAIRRNRRDPGMKSLIFSRFWPRVQKKVKKSEKSLYKETEMSESLCSQLLKNAFLK
jgi:hypothetical protein